MRPENNTVERALAELASKSHGVVTRADLLTTGLTLAEFRTRVRDGSLIRVHRGVYRVGHQAPSLEARYMAAVKAAGTGALSAGAPPLISSGSSKAPLPSPRSSRLLSGVPGASRSC